MTDVTVAICTYRRANLLPQTLRSFAAMHRPTDTTWDLLIVDNACDPRVERVVADFAGELPVRYAAEPQVGIARARNRAVASTDAPIILFADDDVTFDPDWLVNMTRAFREHSECSFWGGRIAPAWQTPRPAWFDTAACPMLGDAIVTYDAGQTPRAWDPARDAPFYTCSLALRTEAIHRAGLFDVSLGHIGDRRGGGEDSWMVRAIAQAGGRGWYAADALVHHPVPADRATKRFARRFAWYQGRVSVDMLLRQEVQAGRPARPPRWLYRRAVEDFCRGVQQGAAGFVWWQPGLRFAGQFRMLYGLSKFWHAMRHRPDDLTAEPTRAAPTGSNPHG
jgi:glucosyl-dolichyl phosphate glucuronosyltransferase